jgi:osmoprotectant transport system substrate-binding protein
MASRAVTAAALASGEIDVGMLETTDPHLADGTLVLLADDRRLQPAEHVVPVLRKDVVARYGDALVQALDRISAALTTKELIGLNKAAVLDRQPLDQVVQDWLARKGLQ